MSHFTVRRLLIDLETPLPRRWCRDDAFLTALFNALSMSFPVGEQFFIDSVRAGFLELSPEQRAAMKDGVDGFIGQEATHRRVHALFNQHLEKQGLLNTWSHRVMRRLSRLQNLEARHYLGLTAAYEHFTAIFADWLLGQTSFLDACEPRLKTMWLWHSAEESEHKSLAFDLYRALGGSHAWRVRWFRRVTFFFLTDLVRQTVRNLHSDGALWKWSTLHSAWHFLLGRQGLLRLTYGPWRQYYREDFHPDAQETTLAQRWLADNAGQYVVVRAANATEGATAPAASGATTAG
jgi:predicted metal-dependent hydrolase